MATSDTRVLTAHVPVILAQEVDALAERLERPRGWIVKEALAAFVAQEARRHQMTLDALADVDAGRTIGQAQVEAWATSLSQAKPLPLPE